jgi:hypothetical protein
MPILISDTRPGDVKAVQSFCGAKADSARQVLSLTAYDEQDLVGALICRAKGKHGAVRAVTVRGKDAEHAITTTLLDKAVRKLQVLGNHHCRIKVVQSEAKSDTSGFWRSVMWSDRPEFQDDGQVIIRVSGLR